MESKILQVFYGNDCLPYKDSNRAVHFPIVGNAFQGANNTTEIRFYYGMIGGDDTTWIAVTKLPNGKIGSKVLTSHLDSELNEYYAKLELSTFYTQYKGDVYISLQGYQGGVQVTEDDDVYTITGTPTIRATGSIKLAINYATQFVGSGEEENVTLQEIFGYLATKLDINKGIVLVANITTADLSGYDNGQLFYCLTYKQYYEKTALSPYYQVAENYNGILGSKRTIVRYLPTTLNELWSWTGTKLCIVTYDSKDYLVQMNTATRVCALLLDTLEFWWDDELEGTDSFSALITNENKITYVEKTHSSNKLYGTNNSGNQTTLNYGVDPTANYIPQRDSNSQINVPIAPTANSNATSKKYVDDLIATIKSNAFILVNTTTYPTLASFLASTGEEGYIYLYPVDESGFDEGDPQKGYYQYIWEGSEWLLLGTTQIDLSDYYTKTQTNALLNLKANDNVVVKLSGNQTIGGTKTFSSSPIIPNPTNGTDAANKNYVDSQYTSLNNSKVDKTNSGEKVYGTDELGAQMTYDVDSDLVGDGAIVRRNTPSGTIVTGTPTSNTHATTKAYVDSSIANAISNVYKIKGSATVAQINALTNQQVGDVYNVTDSGTIVLGNLQVFTGDNIVWTGSAWDKLGAEIDWTAYDEKFIAAGFFEVQPYNESTGEITIVYSTELYVMSYDGDTGVMTIEAN